jgi:hypothetical protein
VEDKPGNVLKKQYISPKKMDSNIQMNDPIFPTFLYLILTVAEQSPIQMEHLAC